MMMNSILNNGAYKFALEGADQQSNQDSENDQKIQQLEDLEQNCKRLGQSVEELERSIGLEKRYERLEKRVGELKPKPEEKDIQAENNNASFISEGVVSELEFSELGPQVAEKSSRHILTSENEQRMKRYEEGLERTCMLLEQRVRSLEHEKILKHCELLELRVQELEQKTETDPEIRKTDSWFTIEKRNAKRNAKPARTEEDKIPKDGGVQLSESVYSILASWDWKTIPFWYSIATVFCFQILLLALLYYDQLRHAKTPLSIPENVEWQVRVGQFCSILIALFTQVDLHKAIDALSRKVPLNFRGRADDYFKDMTQFQWNLAHFLLFAQGFTNLLASFILAIQSETVFDLLVNFLGLQFLTDLDNKAFQLGKANYFGKTINECCNAICRAKFAYRSQESKQSSDNKFVDEEKCSDEEKCTKPWSKKKFGALLVLVGFLATYVFFVVQQMLGLFSVDNVFVEFGDDALNYMGLFNGCYKKRSTRPHVFAERLLYEQVGDENGGKFGYCDDFEDDNGESFRGWVFFDGPVRDPCEDFIARSGETKTFDILEVGDTQWFTKGSKFPLQLKVTETFNSDLECGKTMFDSSRLGCEKLAFKGTLDALEIYPSRYFQKLDITDVEMGIEDFADTSLSRPIYVGDSTNEVILFTGRRWIMTTTGHISGLAESIKSRSSNYLLNETVRDFFYKAKGFQSNAQTSSWILLISETVESMSDAGEPLGLQWYYPRTDVDSAYNFSGADLTRPAPSTFVCASCNNKNNKCSHEGVCLSDGTCDCKHGTSGSLCRTTPLGDGVCNDYFNTADFHYDGGDCCAATCEGLQCGLESVAVPSGVIEFDVNTTDNLLYGFGQCNDPETLDSMVLFTITFLEVENSSDPVTVLCDGQLILKIPSIFIGTEFLAGSTVSFYAPQGAQCESATQNRVVLHLGKATTSKPFEELEELSSNESDGGSQRWNVPSKCIAESISKHADFAFNRSIAHGKALDVLDGDDTSEKLCRDDESLFLERYALTLLNISLGMISSPWGEPCQDFESLKLDCHRKDSTISSLLIFGNSAENGTIPTEIAFLSNLKSLAFQKLSNLTGTLPTELGNMQSLEEVNIKKTGLSGQIPSELSKLTKLEIFYLSDNLFTGKIPTELSRLESHLKSCEIRGSRNLTGDTSWCTCDDCRNPGVVAPSAGIPTSSPSSYATPIVAAFSGLELPVIVIIIGAMITVGVCLLYIFRRCLASSQPGDDCSTSSQFECTPEDA